MMTDPRRNGFARAGSVIATVMVLGLLLDGVAFHLAIGAWFLTLVIVCVLGAMTERAVGGPR